MDGYLTLFLLSGSALVVCSGFQYVIINTTMTWPEAQQYCRQHYSDLATFESLEDMQHLQTASDDFWMWIGLYDEPGSWQGVMGGEPNSWRWSVTGETSPNGYQVWAANEPNYFVSYETCVMMAANGKWQDKPCYTLTGFLCFTEIGPSSRSYEYIGINSTWADAQTYCRQHHTDLAVIESATQNSDANSTKLGGSEAWIGLYRDPWVWSDQSLSSFRNWKNYSPNYPSLQHCTCMSVMDHTWDDDYCDREYRPLCQEDRDEVKRQSLVKVTMKTGADITQSLNNAQILQMVEEELKRRGYTGLKLTWRTGPSKQTT